MPVSTLRLVGSRTFSPPLITRETVPTPTPDAAATSAMVTRPDGGIRPPAHWNRDWNRFHICADLHSVSRCRQEPGGGHCYAPRQAAATLAGCGCPPAGEIGSGPAGASFRPYIGFPGPGREPMLLPGVAHR